MLVRDFEILKGLLSHFKLVNWRPGDRKFLWINQFIPALGNRAQKPLHNVIKIFIDTKSVIIL